MNDITYIVPLGDVKYQEHNLNGTRFVLSISSSYEEERLEAISRFSFPLIDTKTTNIKAIKLETIQKVTGPTLIGTVEFGLIIDGQYYIFENNENLSEQGIFYLNEYKANHKKYPEIELRVKSLIDRPLEKDGKEVFESQIFDFQCALVEGTIRGGICRLKPVIDRQVGHSKQDGYDSIFSLLKETNADNEATAIKDVIQLEKNAPAKETSLTSIVGLQEETPQIFLNKKHILAATWVITDQANSGIRGSSEIIYTLSSPNCQDHEEMITKGVLLSSWKTHYHRCDTSEGSLINYLNQYLQANSSLPEINMEIETKLSCHPNSLFGETVTAYVTQAYLEVVYEDLDMGVRQSVNDEWKVVQEIYRKEKETYKKISRDEYNLIINNSLLLKGDKLS